VAARGPLAARAQSGSVRLIGVLMNDVETDATSQAYLAAFVQGLRDLGWITTLHNNDEYWVGVVCAEGSDFTAGLDMPRFFGPKAEKWGLKEGNIDVFGLANRCRKPIVTAPLVT
jgi:enoyl-CoA hydratase